MRRLIPGVPRRLGALGPIAALSIGLAGCAPAASSTAATAGATGTAAASAGVVAGLPSPGSSAGLSRPAVWLIGAHSLDLIRQSGGDGALGVQRLLSDSTPLVIVGRGAAHPPAGITGTFTNTFDSVADLESAMSADGIPSWVHAVVYDNEAWSLTPQVEQQDPRGYEAMAARLAHQRGLVYVAAPATDLARVLTPGATDQYAAYLALGLAGIAAANADVVDIQAQGAEADPTHYAAFVTAAVAQARAANPRVLVLAGLSTNPRGHPATPDVLMADVLAVRGQVDGYWLNVPGASAACPDCGTPRADIAAGFLRMLYST